MVGQHVNLPVKLNSMPDPTVKEQVKQAIDNDGGTAPAAAPENLSSPEVKKEIPVVDAPKEPITVDKLQEQVSNLNIALKEARAEAKTKVDLAKVEELEKKLQEREGIISRLQNAFSPEKPAEETKPEYMTKEEAEALWQQKQEELKQMSFKEKQAEVIKSEIALLEKDWSGADGRPKYLDEEVLKWQQANNKLYLTPVEAFNQMKKNEIIDWEVKQRLAGKRPTQNVEKPGVSPDMHVPADFKPKSDKELQDAIREAINLADVEM